MNKRSWEILLMFTTISIIGEKKLFPPALVWSAVIRLWCFFQIKSLKTFFSLFVAQRRTSETQNVSTHTRTQTYTNTHSWYSFLSCSSLTSRPKKFNGRVKLDSSHIRHSSDSSYTRAAEVEVQPHTHDCWHTNSHPRGCRKGNVAWNCCLHYVGHRQTQSVHVGSRCAL